jgi:hypothetical protein
MEVPEAKKRPVPSVPAVEIIDRWRAFSPRLRKPSVPLVANSFMKEEGVLASPSIICSPLDDREDARERDIVFVFVLG